MSWKRITGLAALLAIPFVGAASVRAATAPRIVFAADRAPSVSGEIYRLDPNGHRVDLSRSPYQDTNPAVSWDGKHVAFVSDRGGTPAIYEVKIDGRGLVRVGPSLQTLADAGCDPQLEWQPHGNVLAVAACGGLKSFLWIIREGHKPLRLIESKNGIEEISWSPDGRILVASPFRGQNRAFSPSGRPLWTAQGFCCGAWSPQGLLALPLRSRFGFHVYDESGHLRFAASGSLSGGPAWSQVGRLAVIRRNRLEVRTATGGLVFAKALSGGHGLVWADNSHVIVGGYGTCFCKARSVAIPTGTVSSASGNWFDPLSPDRKLAIVTPRAKNGQPFRLGVGPPPGAFKTYTHVGGCYNDGVWTLAATSIQFVGRSRSLVYQSGNSCDPPFANLYSASPDGGAVTRLTHVLAQETQPAVSPDSSEIAYVRAAATGLSCKGCADGIRIASAGGKEVRTLTNPQDCTFDDSPTWSPDGSTILFSESSCSTPGELFTVPGGGGPVHDLAIAGSNPAWGPSRIAYVGSEQSDSGVWTANPDGSDPVKVAKSGEQPAWSSDGRLAYLQGTNGRTLVVGSKSETLPFVQVKSLAWSPDGTRFVVTARTTKTGPFDVYSVKTNGTGPVRLTKNYDAVGGASWR